MRFAEASPVPVLGVIEPGARAAVAAAGQGPVGVIGTAGTIHSNAYVRAIHAIAPAMQVEQQACPLFVPLVEEGWFDHPAGELIAQEYLRPLRDAGVDGAGARLHPLSPAEAAAPPRDGAGDPAHRQRGGNGAHSGGRLCGTRTWLPRPGGPAAHRFVVSDDEPRFRQVGARFIGERLTGAEVVALG